jgi:hypothetical protein
MNVAKNDGWTAKSIGMATVVSVTLFLVFKQLAEIGIGLELNWEVAFVPALGGAVVLGARHRRTWWLALLLFLPSMTFVLFWMAFLMAFVEGDAL